MSKIKMLVLTAMAAATLGTALDVAPSASAAPLQQPQLGAALDGGDGVLAATRRPRFYLHFQFKLVAVKTVGG